MRLLAFMLRGMIHEGSLAIIDPAGRRHVFGDGSAPTVTFRLHRRSVALKLAINPHLYLGEAYMDGGLSVEQGDIYSLLDLLTRNIGRGYGNRAFAFCAALRLGPERLRQHIAPQRAKRNVAHHYDLSDRLYDLFLDRDRQYSCAYFIDPDDSLEQAQLQKKAHIAAKLCLAPGQRVLDIGSGWGGLSRYLARIADVSVSGITLSEKQLEYALAQNRRDGPGGKVDFSLADYRQISGTFDRIVSVGMFEHVGLPQYDTFFTSLYSRLNDDGVALVHTIGRTEGPSATNAWIEKYIFPGGYIPALSEILPAIERSGLIVTDIEILRLHYAETLAAWRARFAARRDTIRALYDERFCRMWEFYMAVSEVAFRNCGQVVFQIQVARRQDAVPLTRDYIAENEQALLAATAIAA